MGAEGNGKGKPGQYGSGGARRRVTLPPLQSAPPPLASYQGTLHHSTAYSLQHSAPPRSLTSGALASDLEINGPLKQRRGQRFVDAGVANGGSLAPMRTMDQISRANGREIGAGM